MDQLSLLLVDDDEQLCEIISTYLELEGFTVKAVHRADSFRNALARSHFDLVIIDLNLPDASGLDLVVELDERGDAGIIVLTGSDQKVDKIIGLERGADDFIQKPFDQRELLARIRSVLRRRKKSTRTRSNAPAGTIQAGVWTIDKTRHEVKHEDGSLITLTNREFELLALLAGSANQVVTREQISSQFTKKDWNPTDRSIDVMVSKLRKKLSADKQRSALIKTIRGVGYVLAFDE